VTLSPSNSKSSSLDRSASPRRAKYFILIIIKPLFFYIYAFLKLLWFKY
jgi:hypothetical protein